MIVELHSLTSHAPANLNRDDLGRPKSAVFGGTQRARISSQAIKRSIRTSNYLEEILRDGLSTRSRQLPKMIHDSLAKEFQGDEKTLERLRSVCEAFAGVLGKADKKDPLHTSQIVFLTPGEIERAKKYIRSVVTGEGKLGKKELEAFTTGAAVEIGLNRNPGDGVDMALFGRMTTDSANAFADVDAAMQVAHAISTHTATPEVDWFTAVDDITTGGEETGSGHLGEVEFNSAVFYKYFSCNLPLLIRNMNGDRSNAVDALTTVLDAACRVTPSGKQNTFASHSLADTVLLVLRPERIPVSLANAFEKSVPKSEEGYLAKSRERLAKHYKELRDGYDLGDTTILFTTSEEERTRLAGMLPEGVQIASTLGEVFTAMKQHIQEMLPAEGTEV